MEVCVTNILQFRNTFQVWSKNQLLLIPAHLWVYLVYLHINFLKQDLPDFLLQNMTEIFSHTACRQLLQMLFAIIFFHISEYILAIAIHGKMNVTLKSLLVSKHYLLAMICSMLEYIVEIYIFPGLKEHWCISNVGLVLVVIGEIIRKLAIVTAGRAFTHLIKRYHEDHHQLVTHGVYRYIRHPGYCGFFIWSVGTQIMLCNPLSTLAFALVVFRFFQQRIPYEEHFLRQFFGSEYEDYSRRTSSGIPFLKWCSIELFWISALCLYPVKIFIHSNWDIESWFGWWFLFNYGSLSRVCFSVISWLGNWNK